MSTIVIKSTLNDRDSITSPEVGSAGEIKNMSFVNGVEGKGLQAKRTNSYTAFPIDGLDVNRCSVEFSYKPAYSSTSATTEPRKTLFAINSNAGTGAIKLQFIEKQLVLTADTSLGTLSTSTSASTKLWIANAWVQIKVEWNTDEDDSMKILVDGVKVNTTTIAGGWNINVADDHRLFIGGLNVVRAEMAEGAIDNLTVNKLDEKQQLTDLEKVLTAIAALPADDLKSVHEELVTLDPTLCATPVPDPDSDPVPDPDPDPVPDPDPDPVPDPDPDPVPDPADPVELTLTLKECSDTALSDFPVSVVVPMPYGKFQTTPVLSVNIDGVERPVQCDVLNRHWAKDNSVRHVVARFQASATAKEKKQFTLKTVGSALAAHSDPVVVSETSQAVTLSTAGKTYRIEKTPFALIMPTGQVACLFNDKNNSPVDLFAENVVVSVEEQGPIQACVKMKGRSWAMRLYVFAGKAYVKLDFQLQNAYGDIVWSEARVFESLAISIPAGSGATTSESITAGPQTAYPTINEGYAGNGRSWIAMRNFKEMWPNKLSANSTSLTAELWPAEFSQKTSGTTMSSTGLYWLDDMQCVIKELYVGFEHEPKEIAHKIQRHPVCVVPTSWYVATGVTFDMDGRIPDVTITEADSINPNYSVYSNQNGFVRNATEKLGWNFFGCDMARKAGPGMAGHWPYSVNRFLLSGNPADYWFGLDLAVAELNCHPEWLFDYNYELNWNVMRPTSDPYGGYSWRKWEGHGTYGSNQIPGYPTGATQQAKPRDDAHGWFYQVEEAYYFTANPWIKDWYKWIGEFRKTRLNEKDNWPDKTGRAMGHSIAHALQAYRVCGDVTILDMTKNYIKNYIQVYIQANGAFVNRPYETSTSEAMFQLGYLAHALITAYHETEDAELKQRAYAVVEGFVRWNLTNSRFGYYNSPDGQLTNADGSSMTFGDPQAWIVMHPDTSQSIKDAARQQLIDFMDGKIGTSQNGVPNTPYVNLRNWQGDYNGRLVTLLKQLSGGNL